MAEFDSNRASAIASNNRFIKCSSICWTAGPPRSRRAFEEMAPAALQRTQLRQAASATSIPSRTLLVVLPLPMRARSLSAIKPHAMQIRLIGGASICHHLVQFVEQGLGLLQIARTKILP
jgi:hypothetical protein